MKTEKHISTTHSTLLWAIVALFTYTNTYGDVPTFAHSYVMTTRQQPNPDNDDTLKLLPSGKMFFCSANGHYVQQKSDYMLDNGTPCMDTLAEADSSSMPSTTFLNKLEEDLRNTVDGTRIAHLILYVHGLGVTFPAAAQEGAEFGLHFQGENVNNDTTGTATCIRDSNDSLPKDCILCPQDARKGLYPGLLITFDWPSFPLTGPPAFELLLLEALLAPTTAKEIRTRADDSAEALANVFAYVVQALRKRLRSDGIKLDSTLIAHSEGNYMVTKGAEAIVARGGRNIFDHIILLAADISSASLNWDQPGGNLLNIGNNITVYYSTSDPDLLVSSYLWSSLHNREFQARLGQTGPYSGIGTSFGSFGRRFKRRNIFGIDATQATNRIIPYVDELSVEDFDNCSVPKSSSDLNTPVLTGLLAQHGSYRCVAEILDDMNMTMLQRLQHIPGANRRLKIPGTLGRFALQTDDNPPLFSCDDWFKAGFGEK